MSLTQFSVVILMPDYHWIKPFSNKLSHLYCLIVHYCAVSL